MKNNLQCSLFSAKLDRGTRGCSCNPLKRACVSAACAADCLCALSEISFKIPRKICNMIELNAPISTRNASMMACSRSISPSGVVGLAVAGGGAVMTRSVAILDNTINDSRRDVRRAVSLSLAAVGGCKGKSVVCVKVVGYGKYQVSTVYE